MAHLQQMSQGTLLIDLAGVSEISTAVAEEIGPIFFQQFMAWRGDREVFVAYANVCEEVARGLEVAFAWMQARGGHPQAVAVAFLSEDRGMRILGRLPPALRAVLLAIYEAQESSAMALESRGIKAASKKLSELVSRYPWLVRKEQRLLGSGAWNYVYSVTPEAPGFSPGVSHARRLPFR